MRAAPLLAILLLLPRPGTAGSAGPDADIILRKTSPPPPGPVAGTEEGAGPSSEPPGGPALGTLAGEGRLLPLLEKSLAPLGESLSTDGALHFPLSGDDTVHLPGKEYPVIPLSTGRSLVIDLEGRLDRREADAIESAWDGYRIIEAPPEESTGQLLDRIFSSSGFHSVTRAETLSIGRSGNLNLSSDFIVLKDPGDLLEGYLYLVNVLDSSEDVLPSAVRDLAVQHRIRVIEIIPARGEVLSSKPLPAPPWSPSRKFTSSGKELLLREIVPALGLKVESDPSVPPAGEAARRSLLLTGGGRECRVSFVPSENPCRLWERQGLACIAAGAGVPFGELLEGILRFFALPFRGPAVEFYRPGGRYTVTVPGFYLDAGAGRPLLLTGEELGGHVSSLITAGGVDILTWVVREREP